MDRHKRFSQDFTRFRKLSFQTLILCLLKKGCKSIQNILNDLFMNQAMNDTVTASAYTQARKKLKHTAFKEMNDQVLKTFMGEVTFHRYKGYRLLGVDGSILNLPDHPDIAHHFGTILNTNQTGMLRSYSSALFVACYDVLNGVCVNADMVSSHMYEASAFQDMMQAYQADPHSIMIFDRGYASYEMIQYLETKGQLYVIRIPRKSFKESQAMFDDPSGEDQTVLIRDHRVRLVRIVLPTGEVEVLATNVCQDVSVEDLRQIYHHRWGVETFFQLIKDRLGLENFTGKTVESVRQDFWSTVFICNLEASVTHAFNQELQHKTSPTQINKCVSFHVLKHKAFDLLYGSLSEEALEQQLRQLFLTGQTPHGRKRVSTPRQPSRQRTIKHLKYS